MQITKYYSRGKIKNKKQKKHTTDPRRRKQKNKYIKWKEIEFIILKLSPKSPDQMVSLEKLSQIFREELKPSLNNLSQKMEEEETLPQTRK